MRKPNGWYTGKVRLFDLPHDLIYVDLKKKYKTSFLREVRKIIGSWRKACKKSGISHKKLEHFRNGHKLSLKDLLKIRTSVLKKNPSSRLNLSLAKIEQNVNRVGTKSSSLDSELIKIRFPIDFNCTAGGRIVAAILHDGGIKRKNLIPHYSNTIVALRKAVYQAMHNLFGPLRTKCSSLNRFRMEFPSIVGYILVHGLGLVFGNKLFVEPKVPNFIFTTKREIRQTYLRQAFSDDGCVVFSNKYKSGRFLALSGCSSKASMPLIRDNMKLLESLGYRVEGPYAGKKYLKIYNGKTYIIRERYIRVVGYWRLKKFSKNIGFEQKYKRMRLRGCLQSYTKTPSTVPHGLR